MPFMATQGLKLEVFTQTDRLREILMHNFSVETPCRQKMVTVLGVAKFRDPSETTCMVPKYRVQFQLDTSAT